MCQKWLTGEIFGIYRLRMNKMKFNEEELFTFEMIRNSLLLAKFLAEHFRRCYVIYAGAKYADITILFSFVVFFFINFILFSHFYFISLNFLMSFSFSTRSTSHSFKFKMFRNKFSNSIRIRYPTHEKKKRDKF